MDPVPLTFQAPIADWGWMIAWFFWFIAIGGMLSVAYVRVRRAAVAVTILVTVAIGLALVFFHLGRWWNMPLVVWTMITEGRFNFGSWMFLGVLILTAHLALAAVMTLAHAEALLRRLPWLGLVRALASSAVVLGLFAAVGLLAVVYSGFLLTQASGIPLWGTPLIPVLWVISSAVAAVAALELMAVAGVVEEEVSVSGLTLGLGLDALKLLAVLAFLYVSLGVGSAAARLGAREMVSGSLAWMTWGGVVAAGILVPMALGAWMMLRGRNRALLALSSVSALAGVLFLRAAVLLAGAWEPLA